MASTLEGSPSKEKIMTLRKWTRPANHAMLEWWNPELHRFFAIHDSTRKR
jgi:hypothetical protein